MKKIIYSIFFLSCFIVSAYAVEPQSCNDDFAYSYADTKHDTGFCDELSANDTPTLPLSQNSIEPRGEKTKEITLPESGASRELYTGSGAKTVTVTFTLTRGPTAVSIRIYQLNDNGEIINENRETIEMRKSVTASLDAKEKYYIEANLVRGETGRATFVITSST